jgi:L-arabinonolactonase
MITNDIECVVHARATLGEGCCWDSQAQCLWWVDIQSQHIHRYDPATSARHVFRTPARPGCLAVREQGGLVVAMAHGFYGFDPKTEQFDLIQNTDEGSPDVRMNDGRTDRHGRFWAGTTVESQAKPPQTRAALYRLDTDLSSHRIAEGFTCSNGLAWSPDSRTMYFTDSATPYVWCWDFEPTTGEIEHQRVFIDLSSINAIGDGATVDAEGCYWLTLPFKGQVHRYDPTGKLMHAIKMPTDTPTCCEFGGQDLNVLYVTSATLNRSTAELERQVNPGGLFAIRLDVKGLPACPFAG